MNSIARSFTICLGLGTAILLSACGKLIDVNVTVVDQKTALENQILGSYEELGNEMVLLASVRSMDENGKLKTVAEIPPGKKRAIRAMQRVEFNRDDIQMFKKRGCAGEANDGRLKFFKCPKAATDPKFEKFAQTLIKEENEDRSVILQRIIATNIDLSEADLPEVWKVYASLNRNNSQPGDKIQMEDGSWGVK